MKKIYTLILCGFVAGNILAATADNNPAREHLMKNRQAKIADNKTDAVVYLEIASRSNSIPFGAPALQGQDSTVIQYDAFAHDTVTTVLHYHPNPTSWVNYSKQTKTYNGSHILTGLLKQNWDTIANQWVNFTQTTYTLDGNGNATLTVIQKWLVGTSQWQNQSRTSTVYNSFNKIVTATGQQWDNVGQTWKNYSRNTNTFDSIGSHIMTTTFEYAFSGPWLNDSKVLYTRDPSYAISGTQHQRWSATASSWVDVDRYAYVYGTSFDVLILTTHDVYDTVGSAWVQDTKNTFSIDGNGNSVLELDSTWNTGSNAFVPTEKDENLFNTSNDETSSERFAWSTTHNGYVQENRYTYTFDGNHNNTYGLIENYDTTSQTYKQSFQYYLYYQAFTVSGIAETESIKNMSIYPNPASGNGIFARFSLLMESKITINVFNNEGKLVSTQTSEFGAGENNTRLNVSGLSNGMYYVQYQNTADNTTATLSLVVQ